MYLQLDTEFNPFTYDEMMKPLLYYKQAYDEADATYSDLVAQTEAWKDIANREKSPRAFEMYQRYSNELSKAVDDFSQGMTAKNKSALLGLKRRYLQDIQPIANAHARMTALADEQRQAELTDPTRLWERQIKDMSIDDFIINPNANYGRTMSGATLTAQVAAGAEAIAKEFRDDPQKMKELLGNNAYEYVQERGLSSAAILDVILNNKNASPILTQLIENVVGASGIKDWKNPLALERAYDFARQGAWNAAGQEEIVPNWGARENLTHQHAAQREKDQHDRALERAYLSQTATPYLKADGTLGYYSPITKNEDGSYSRTPTPTDAIRGNIKEGEEDLANSEDTVGDSYIPNTNVKKSSMRQAMSLMNTNKGLEEIRKLGYEPKYVLTYTSYDGKGKWTLDAAGQDQSAITGWAWNTNSNLITKWGNTTNKPLNNAERSWVENSFTIPEDALRALNSMPENDDVEYELQRVKRKKPNEHIEYDYIVYIKNK